MAFYKCQNRLCNRKYQIKNGKTDQDLYCPVCKSKLDQGLDFFDVQGKNYETLTLKELLAY